MRFHVVCLPHTSSTLEYLPCAYSQKQRNFVRMMMSRGHEVFHYGTDIDTEVTEHITIVTKDEQKNWFGDNDWKKDFFKIEWDASQPYWQVSNFRAIAEISKRYQPGDFVCIIGGNCQKPIADMLPDAMCVEYGIGYEGVFAPYRVFESYAWLHYVYGRTGQKDGGAYDAVIPNYFDPDMFPLQEQKDDYYLYIGRLISRKGIEIADLVCKQLGVKLKVIGQGADFKDGKLVGDGIEFQSDVEYLGVITDPAEKAKIMGRAKAVFVPTQYIGPFEGVHVEAMLCGTPVITSDWGVFAETVEDHVTGFRARTLGEFVWAAQNVQTLNPALIHEKAVRRFSLARVAELYEAYFLQLQTLYKSGWYELDSVGVEKLKRYS